MACLHWDFKRSIQIAAPMAGMCDLGAERLREAVVAAAANGGLARAWRRIGLENKARVIIEIAGEAGAEMKL